MSDLNDTISAIATPIGEGGLGVIRISGNRSIEYADKLFRANSNCAVCKMKTHTAHYGHVIDIQTDEIIDDGIITIFRAPSGYTGEDTVEISCHGGLAVLRRVLESSFRIGSRLAEPGEFTKRAFLNGKLDLSQAEAVLDIIKAKTDDALRVARKQLDGYLSGKIKDINSSLLGLLAMIEASIDFPDDVDEPESDEIIRLIKSVVIEIENLLSTADGGRIYREGLSAVIIGLPNVGKSSLLNALLRESRAIVTPIPGTTRDVIEEQINIKGIPVKAIDTAGIRDTDDIVEQLGVERTHLSAEQADILILVIDVDLGFTEDDKFLLNKYKDKPFIVVLNKTDRVIDRTVDDLRNSISLYLRQTDNHSSVKIIGTSIPEYSGINDLEDAIVDTFIAGNITSVNEIAISNLRHKEALSNALASLNDSLETAMSEMPVDLISIDIKIAIESLGYVTGETVAEDVIDKIFSEFCIGK